MLHITISPSVKKYTISILSYTKFLQVRPEQRRGVRASKQQEVQALDHGERGDRGGDGQEEKGRQEPGLQVDGSQAGRDPEAVETPTRQANHGSCDA